jgi:hypothetical protein
VRSQAKAGSVGLRNRAGGDGRFVLSPLGIVSLIALCLVASLAVAAQAGAATVTERPFLFSFKPAGGFTSVHRVAIDNVSGAVYVGEAEPLPGSRVYKFHPDGTPWNFSATESPVLSGRPGHPFANGLGVAVDNSGGPNQGRLYVSEFGGASLDAFDPSGEFLWATHPESQGEDVAIDSEGHPWAAASNGEGVFEFANNGALLNTYPIGAASAIDLDQAGDLFLDQEGAIQKWVGGSLSSTVDPSASDVYVDQSSPAGHIFTVERENNSFTEFDSNGTEIATMGGNYLGNPKSIAYSPSLDRVYVAQEGTNPSVAVFGPIQTGTVPNTSIEAPSGVGISSAHFSGTVNPQGVASEWHFEWRKVGSSWAESESSPAQSLPVDSSAHAVEFTTNSLRGGTTYEVRLVGVNSSNSLAGFSSSESFTTTTAPAAPAVTIDSPAAIAPTSATISGTINPQGDTADWRVQLSTDPACSSGFINQPQQQVHEGSATPVNVSFGLTGLLPSETYCARISATNSAGSTVSGTQQFTTSPVAPVEVQTMPAAPVLDTTARLNARVNPQGEDLTYHFEYSRDGGTTWTALVDKVDTSGSRKQKVISEEATGLEPNTTYSYRVTVENPVGGGQGETLSFTTRTTAAVTLPQRGYELVNTPDKGNQTLETLTSGMGDEPISPDGEKVLWKVNGGAPQGYNGTGAAFLAERSPSGWHSRSLLPPAEDQIGGGSDLYSMVTHTPDLSSFVFSAARSVILAGTSDATVLRLDDHEAQTPVRHYEENVSNENIDTTTDGSHILRVDHSTGQLVDIGSGADEVVSIMPDGNPSSCGLVAGESFTGKREDGGTASGVALEWHPGYHLINTNDASIVYFEAKPNSNCSAQQGLYVRNRADETTTLIDPGLPPIGRSREPIFIRATPDGRYGYFITPSQLASNDKNEDRDIYRWDNQTGQADCLTCVVADAAVGEETGNSTTEQVLISDDFSHIYFVSKKQLDPGKGVAGEASLYSLSDGVIHFVAAVSADLSERGAQISESGDSLVFIGNANPNLTGDSVGLAGSHGQECLVPLGSGEKSACEELYRYQDSNQSVECLSCNRDGNTRYSTGTPCGCSNSGFAVSADGDTVIFATKERLIERDINGTTDIYQWHNGALGLITDGVSKFQENFAAPFPQAVSADGRDIFFRVQEPDLTGYEQDRLANLYDARVGGGFERPVAPSHCSEESCQGPLQSPPGQRQSGSSSFSGRGNVAQQPKASRCRKGRVRRHGRCVGRHAHKSHHKRASKTNRGGAN